MTILLLGFCILLAGVVSFSGQKGVEATDSEAPTMDGGEAAAEHNESIANCRYGVVAGYGVEEQVAQIGAGWHLDFNPPRFIYPPSNNAEFVRVFMVFQNKTQDGQYLPGYRTRVPLNASFANLIKAHPGSLWLIGNEVDRGPNPDKSWSGQGDMHPEVYAQAYHDVREFIKDQDPTARTAISGLVQVTPGRLQYLDKVWQAYEDQYGGPMPVDVWNMHLYVLPEVESDGITPNGIASVAVGTDPTLGIRGSGGDAAACSDADVYCFAEHDSIGIFEEQIVAMRQWMKRHGQQQKPLILSEFSLLFPYIDEGASCYLQDEFGNCFTPDRVKSFMTNVFNLLNQLQDTGLGYGLDNNRLVQQWNWFSLYSDEIGTVSNVLQADEETLSEVGETYKQSVLTEALGVNLQIDEVPTVTTAVGLPAGKATAQIGVSFRNNGNTAVDEPFTVTFYRDEARMDKIGSVVVADIVRGCATIKYTAEVSWPGLVPGIYPFWVTVDSGGDISEMPPGQQGNLGSGLVIVHAQSSFIPIVMR